MLITESLHQAIVDQTYKQISYDLSIMLKRLKETAEYISKQTMSKPSYFYDKLKFPDPFCVRTGVYFIIHAPSAKYNFETWSHELGADAKIMYVGQGNISQRKQAHLQVFRNQGNPKVYYNNKTGKISSQSDSVAARKMYRHDSNLRNWRFSYILAEKDWSPILEDYYIQQLNPIFNDEKMSGLS